MDKFILVRVSSNGMPEYLNEDNWYTNNLRCALVFESESKALRECIDDEFVAVLVFNDEGCIIGYEAEHEGYREVSHE